MEHIEKEYNAVCVAYPTLKSLQKLNGYCCISGTLSVIDGNQWNWGAYQVEVLIPYNYPKSLPVLREIGGLIKREEGWHISKEGICCVGTPARQFRDLADGISLVKWIKLFVLPYLANHVYKTEKQDYVDGELSHGIIGIFEDYALWLGLSTPNAVVQYLEYILGISRLSLNATCFCNSGKKYKRCYLLNKESHFHGIPSEILISDLTGIKSYYKV